ncbi:hypothetical protein BDV96DRAFT_500493 [Lophiotrema nucula]|uniref:Uncharacterized protein n=1 Tax=Lophiotrema nucula TaxID=690887 RepID=A0A6A5YUV8_9PLEO|nr:hypothetical protein BDV96DRAFT_500493 [Lophiotrema nucula]
MGAVGLSTTGCFALLSITVLYYIYGTRDTDTDALDDSLPAQLKTFIFPCRTTHARIFPKKHVFNYSYLQYGIPIVPGDAGKIKDKKAVPIDRTRGSWWLRVHADDYLFRGRGELGFYLKLKAFLQDQGVEGAEWSYAYLVTAPRFLGYAFNPVSFWYIYDQSHELKRMILEVNNTFGEKRPYLLDGTSPGSPPRGSDYDMQPRGPDKNRFTDVWMKDFHVSPFNSRKGVYALKALNPFPNRGTKAPVIDNTITLKSSKDHAKLVARIFSTGPPLTLSDLGLWGTIIFIAGWWWVGFLTFPRIVNQAGKLFFSRGLHVWFRPEVLSSSIGRDPTPSEIHLQGMFRQYLHDLVQSSSSHWNITYLTSIPDRPQELLVSTHNPDHAINSKRLEIRVLTPAFYSRFVHYRHTSEAFDRESLFTDEKNRTLWISNPELLPKLLPKPGVTISGDEKWPGKRSFLDEVRWSWLRKLRCEPASPAYPISPKLPPEVEVNDIRSVRFSDLDTYVRERCGSVSAADYRRIVTKIFLSRYTFRFAEVVSAVDLLLRYVMSYLGTEMLSEWARQATHYGVGRYLERPAPGTCVAHLRGASTEWYYLVGLGFWMFACHFYGMLKGYR